MSDELVGLGLDTDHALGMDDTTWSTGVGDLASVGDLSAEGIALGDEVAGAPSLAAPIETEGFDASGHDVASLPRELTFGTLSPAGVTADSYAEDYHWDSARNSMVGKSTGREIDEWTDTAKK